MPGATRTNRIGRGDVRTVWIGSVWPELDGGRFPVKREVGDLFEVTADILREGYEALAAVLQYRTVKDTAWHEVRMEPLGNDRWVARFPLEENTRYLYTIETFPDHYRSWAEDLKKRLAAGMEVTSELLEGAALLRQTLPRAVGADRKRLEARLADFEDATSAAARARILLDEETAELLDTYPDRSAATRYDRELEVIADRVLARFAAWYEMFPRSQGRLPGRHGTFKDCIDRLPDIAAMGFDVIYLPPIHPIGVSFRKGKNNRLTAGPDDPGSPWAIGNEQGGHKAVEPALGTLDDFRALVQAARELGMEVALDYALQCSPDHPYVREHPEWFHARPDGTIKYAENPPKKYQDIYPLNFYCRDREGLWEEMKSILLFWIQQGVRIFRVDNPHTKPIPFWAWLIGEVQAVYPDVIFLSEAFTRPKVMQALAKVGFTQSYTYFTWRNFKPELTDYFTELTQGESLWVQVVYKNVGTVPIIIAKEELEPPSRFFGHSVGMKFKLTVEGGDLSFMMGQAMDNHPPLDCMSQAELDKFFGKGPPAVPGYQVLPGEEIATRPYAYWRATDQYCKRTPPPVGKAPFSEIAQVGYLTPGRYVLEARLEKYSLSGPGQVVSLSADFPSVPITVRP